MANGTFILLTDQKPRSVNKSSERYVEYVAKAASARMQGKPKLTGALAAHIVWFHRTQADTDADNIAKRHLDGLRQVVFADDSSIVRCTSERVDLRRSIDVDVTTLGIEELQQLLEMLGDTTRENIVFVRIEASSDAAIKLSPR